MIAAGTQHQARRGRPGRAALRRFLPPQHGAWAMLLLPYLTGLVVAGPRWLHAPLLVAWLGGYLLSYYVLQAVKTRRPDRVRPQLVAYACLTLPAATLVVAARPQVLAYAPAYAALLAVNAWYAWRRDERALAGGLASAVQSCLMIFVVATVAGVDPGAMVAPFAVVLAYFVGTVLYVKTMIRERDSAAYRRWSIAYHVAALAAVGWLSVPTAVLFALLAARAWALPGRGLRPAQVGAIEIVFSVALLAVAATR